MKRNKRIYFIESDDALALDENLVGAKAKRLAILLKKNFPVPEFFVIPATATTRILSKPKVVEKLKSKIADYIEKKNWENFDFAVRSSSPNEDKLFFSSAGQFKTFLNRRGADEIWKAVELCAKSAHASNVRTYLNQFGDFHKRLQIAVIVQKMVQPNIAGVVFTKNPLTNNSESLLVEVVEGSGEKLVSGQNEPMRIKVDRSTRHFFPVAGNDLQNRVVSKYDAQIDELFVRALEIERLFAKPQDIEWAIAGNQAWILQTRPITRAKADLGVKKDSHGRLWTHYFFAERFAQPISPLGWSILRKPIEQSAFAEPLWYLGEEKTVKNEPTTRLFNGIPFTNLDVFQKLYQIIPLKFISRDKRDALLLDSREQIAISEYFKAGWYLMTRLALHDLNWVPLINLRNWKHFSKTSNEKIRKEAKSNLTSLEMAKERFLKYERLTREFLTIHRWSITFADIFYVILKKFVNYFGDPDAEHTVHDLLTGLPGNLTVEANLQLEKLSRSYQIRDRSKWAVSEFIKNFGHRSESLDIIKPAWGDNPNQIINFIKQLGDEKARSFSENYKKNIAKRIEAEVQCRERIAAKKYFRKPAYFMFRKILKYSREFALLRENQRDLWQRILYSMRQAALFTGKHFAQMGCLKEVDDIFYLSRREFLALSDEIIEEPLLKVIVKRKRLASEYKSGYDSQEKQSKNCASCKSTGLEGLGVSKGIVRGKARVASSYLEASTVQHNEILISHSADPAWTPIYGVIGGLVLEVGGVLSHASIVAREFGLPTVTSVRGATVLIKSGDLIQIDGMKGKVDILQSGEEHRA